MAAEDDPQGYYHTLGLAPNASQEQIAHAYRQWAKAYHPDVSGKVDASNFHRIKVAYDTLGDQKRRAEYDALRHTKVRNGGLPQSENRREKETADRAQSRYCVFRRVYSIFVYTRVDHPSGVFCPQCAAAKSLRESAISWLLGWWSIAGIIETPIALWQNFWMGEKPKQVNASLLMSQAYYFLNRQDLTLAKTCLRQVELFAEGADTRIFSTLQATLGRVDAGNVRDKWVVHRRKESLGHLLPIIILLTLVISTQNFAAVGTSIVRASQAGSQNHPTVSPLSSEPLRAKDIRHTAVPSASLWILKNGRFVVGKALPQFTTVEVLGVSSDPKFVDVRLANGQTGTLAASILNFGDGVFGKRQWCADPAAAAPYNGEIFKQSRTGPNRVLINNSGNDPSVVKFRDALGNVAIALFVYGGSQAQIDDFPDGQYQLEFAIGTDWSRRCGVFLQGMHTQRFPTPDWFQSSAGIEIEQGKRMWVTHFQTGSYTITPVLNGNVHAEPIDQDDFLRD